MKSIEDIVTDCLDVPSKDVIIPQEFEDWITKAVEDYAERHMDDFIVSGWRVGVLVVSLIVKQIKDYLGETATTGMARGDGFITVAMSSAPAKELSKEEFYDMLGSFPEWWLDLFEVACARGHIYTHVQLGKMTPEKIHDIWTKLPSYVFMRDGKRARGDWA